MLIALAIVLAAAIATAAGASSGTALDRYDPAAPGDALLWIPDAAVDGDAAIAGGARFSYAKNPLRLETAGASDEIVTHQLIAHALASAELASRAKLLLDMPFVLSQNAGQAVGDLRVNARAELVEARGAWPAGALELELWLPTGDGDYASSPSLRYGAAAVVGADLDAWLWRARFGARYRRDEITNTGVFGSEVHAALGIAASWDRALLGVELMGATGIESSWFSDDATHLEALLSAKYRLDPFTALVGAGPGLVTGAGTPTYRVIVGIEIGFELASTRRPRARDRDGDGVPDSDDPCPDRVGARGGCPLDTDGDGILDPDDACPRLPGIKRPTSRRHGCPGEDHPGVSVIDTQIVIREQIHFATGNDRLLPDSFPVLGRVAELIAAHPEIARVSVDGHTDDVGDDGGNLTLSRRRALAVVRWLVAHGVDERRLEARGFGARQPLVAKKNDPARTKNRRVEFLILRKSALGKRGWKDGPTHD